MTVITTTSSIRYTGNDIASVFAYNFRIFNDSDLVVTEEVIATEVQTVLVLTTDYTVSGAGNASGGNVTLVAGALPSTKKLIIERDVPQTQLVDLEENSPSPALVTENAYDKLTMLVQQVQDVLDRAMRLGISVSGVSVVLPNPEGDKVLVWASDGKSITNQTLEQTDTGGIANGAVTTEKIAALAVTTGKIAALAVTAAKIAALAITAAQLATDAVESAKIKALAVTAAKLATDAVETAKIKDANVTFAKLEAGLSTLSVKVGAFTRDISLASGTQAVTGVGFQPKAIIFFACQNASVKASWGVSDGTTDGATGDIHGQAATQYNTTTSDCIDVRENAADVYQGDVSALGADGFTINWTKVGTPTGTLNVNYLAIR